MTPWIRRGPERRAMKYAAPIALITALGVAFACSEDGAGGQVVSTGNSSPTPPVVDPARSEPGAYFQNASLLLAQAGTRVEEGFTQFILSFDGGIPSVDEQVDSGLEYAANYMTHLDTLTIGLERLEPPSDVASAHTALLQAVASTLRGWEAFGDRTASVQTQQDLYAAYDIVRVEVDTLIAACDQIGALAIANGASFDADCQAFYFE